MDTANDTRPPDGPPTPPPETRPALGRITRATDDKVISGLCGGLGRHFGIDPLVFRIAFVVMSLAGGTGVLLYLVGWALVPDDQGQTFGAGWLPGKDRGHKLLAAALAGCGVLLLLDQITDGHGDDVPLGLALVGVGAAVLWSRRNGHAGPAGPSPSPPPGPSPSPPPVVDTEPPSHTATLELTARPPAGSPASPVWPPDPLAPPAPAAAPPPPPVVSQTRERKSRSALVGVTLSLLAILAGVLVLADVDAVTGLALALFLVAGALIVGAWRGRARALIPIAVLLSGALFVASLLDVPIKGGAGDRVYAPLSVADVESPYRLAAGELQVDLRRLDLTGRTLRVVASNAMGTLVVTVPPGPAIEVDAHVGAGEMTVFGRDWEGASIDQRVVVGGREGGGRLVLDARVGFGELEVRRAAA